MGFKTSLLVGTFKVASKVLRRAAQDLENRPREAPSKTTRDPSDRMPGLTQRTANKAKSLPPRAMAKLDRASAYGTRVVTEVLAPAIAEALDTEVLKRHPQSRLSSAFKLAQDQLPVLANFLLDVNQFAENWQKTHAKPATAPAPAHATTEAQTQTTTPKPPPVVNTDGSAKVKHEAERHDAAKKEALKKAAAQKEAAAEAERAKAKEKEEIAAAMLAFPPEKDERVVETEHDLSAVEAEAAAAAEEEAEAAAFAGALQLNLHELLMGFSGGVEKESSEDDSDSASESDLVFTPSTSGSRTPSGDDDPALEGGASPTALAGALAGLDRPANGISSGALAGLKGTEDFLDEGDPEALRQEAVSLGARPDPQAVAVDGKPPGYVALDPTKASSSPI